MLQGRAQAEALLDEVPDLVEFPAVVVGRLQRGVPRAARRGADDDADSPSALLPGGRRRPGALMPAFLAVTNTQTDQRARDRDQRRARRHRAAARRAVLLGRRPPGSASRRGLPRLETVLFHKQLGSYRQKTDRIETLARLDGGPTSSGSRMPSTTAARAARLAKADLATDMVREFTELQGTMGGIYAREAGEPEAGLEGHLLPLPADVDRAQRRRRRPPRSARARPRGPPCRWPTSSTRSSGSFLAGERPTGSRDPFGLRRQAHGVLRILLDGEALTGRRLRVPLWDLVRQARERLSGRRVRAACVAICRSSSSSVCSSCSRRAAFDRAQRARGRSAPRSRSRSRPSSTSTRT